MTKALIGYTGFVGQNLMNQTEFDDTYNSKNIEQIRGKKYSTLVCSGAPAAKWVANKQPEEDALNIQKLMENLKAVEADNFILISTIDVYSSPVNVNEQTPVDKSKAQPYGKHRYELEEFAKVNFKNVLVVRLPGLFGIGLKKNIIYDFLNQNAVDMVHSDAIYQFYDLSNLWEDIQTALKAGLHLVNITSEPVSVKEVAKECFSFDFQNKPNDQPAYYDIRSCFDGVFGGANGYLYSKSDVLKSLKEFVAKRK